MCEPSNKPQPYLRKKLPEHAVIYFDHLISEFGYLKVTKSLNDDVKDNLIAEKWVQHVKDLEDKRVKNPTNLSWNDLFSLELLISKNLPKERLLREVWRLRLRYRDVVGFKQYESYFATKPPDVTPGDLDNENEYRADIEYLITEIYLRYTITPYNEELRNKISNRVTNLILVGLFIVISLAISYNLFPEIESWGPVTLLLAMFIGAMGGLLSMQQRYQSVSREGDPIDNISILEQDSSRLFMPAISGAIFAALLYMIMIGGLVQGELFPEFSQQGENDSNNVQNVIKSLAPSKALDFAKLVIWSFLAGFAERFVPDTLSRFISTRESNEANRT